MIREDQKRLVWQSRLILLIVVPWTAIDVLAQSVYWFTIEPVVAWTALGISAAFALIVWKMRAGTPAAAATGAAITASLMYSTTHFPYQWSWLHGGLLPLLAVFLLTYAATKIGNARKERAGLAESAQGRSAAQVSANLGMAALAAQPAIAMVAQKEWTFDVAQVVIGLLALGALAEAAADTVSSEIGQVFGGQPRLLTTLRKVPPGTDGGITLTGTGSGILASLLVACVGVWAFFPPSGLLDRPLLASIVAAAGVFGLLFDSLLGATAERYGGLNNDAVNFLSTLAATIFVLCALFYAIKHIRT